MVIVVVMMMMVTTILMKHQTSKRIDSLKTINKRTTHFLLCLFVIGKSKGMRVNKLCYVQAKWIQTICDGDGDGY